MKDDIERFSRVRVGLKHYKIPVDGRGIVPTWALAQRFQESGTAKDLQSDSPIILPAECTPKELAQWWADPGSCDVRGIDTLDSRIYDVSSVPPSKQMAQRRIAVVTPDSGEQRRIRRILSEAFTAEELEEMAVGGSFVIRTVDSCGDATGCYYRRQDGIEVPLIVIEYNTTPDGIVHEVVHHLRAVGKRDGMMQTSIPVDKHGRMRNGLLNVMPGRRKARILEDEEKLTVAETVVRTGKDERQSGYYDSARGKSPRMAYLEDRHILADVPVSMPDYMVQRKKGKAAVKAVVKGFEQTNIARSEILSRDVGRK